MDGRTRRAEEARELRRRQILETAKQVFSDKGYDRTSITDLVKAAGVARGTFYLYFDSKQAIFRELLEQLLGEMRRGVVGVDVSPGAPAVQDQLRGTVVKVLRTALDNRDLTRIIFRVAVGLDEETDRRMREFYGNLRTWIGASLVMGKQLGVVRDSVNVEVTALCIVGGIREVIVGYVVERDTPFDVEEVANGILDYALNGVRG